MFGSNCWNILINYVGTRLVDGIVAGNGLMGWGDGAAVCGFEVCVWVGSGGSWGLWIALCSIFEWLNNCVVLNWVFVLD